MRLTASEIAGATGGALSGPDVTVEGACIDSRLVQGGELFVALHGVRDGHAFVDAALDAGAAACLVDSGGRDSGGGGRPGRGTCIVVGDTFAGLTALATAARARLPDRVIGITGSVGKTSTKDLLAAALAQRWRVSASPKNFNNELGVPLTILGAPDDAEAVVVEMGARGRGHIAQLCRVARPTVGIVTTVGLSHSEFFGTVEDVARAKVELVEALPADGTAVLNAEVPLVAAMASRSAARVVTFGLDTGDVRAEALSLDEDLHPRFRLRSPWGSTPVTLGVSGRHQVANALAAAAAALACGATAEQVASGLAQARLSPWRMQLDRSPSGAVVINDAYNANPPSTTAALRALAQVPAERRTAVLGIMAELGDVGPAEHARIGALAAELGIRVIAVAAPDYGGEQVGSVEEALDRLGPIGRGDAVLVKGSRAARLETVAGTLAAS
ncbi:MAG TPA: UDP-N-acetylmuramoyl-tripeptide--D-alanyl-D-alanine ligase [Acidimicrobiales bacterium]|nr:UDP-N-acetylmuramoyl-tripeptide--D-alanyl-D-alanine ligase [Acidimicrobiales bacterium]